MILADWLKHEGWTNKQLAQAIGVSENCARMYRAGLRVPTPHNRRHNGGEPVFRDHGAAIGRVTSGAVTRYDLQRAYDVRREQNGGNYGPR